MKISELAKKKTLFSAEVFPPKKNSPDSCEKIYNTLKSLEGVNFDFISVTLGAGGSKESTDMTCEFARAMKQDFGIEPMVHIPGYAFSKKETVTLLDRIKDIGVENVLALRGDRPAGDMPVKEDFKYANELCEFITAYDRSFDIAGGCYPEGHPDSDDLIEDILNLKKKVDAGATHLISQLFFDNNLYYDFLERAKIAGINVPIEAGIMPVVNSKQIERMVSICGASLPPKFTKMMTRYGSNPDSMLDAGIAYAVDQIVDLLSHGVDGVHIYIMNNPVVAKRIYDAVINLI